MSQPEPRDEEELARVAAKDGALREYEAQLDAAIEATFPASDPIASFDFR